jgi:hypothetical protein
MLQSRTVNRQSITYQNNQAILDQTILPVQDNLKWYTRIKIYDKRAHRKNGSMLNILTTLVAKMDRTFKTNLLLIYSWLISWEMPGHHAD